MSEKILETVKRNLSGIEPDNTDFDLELIDHINSRLRALNRLGIGKSNFIADENSVWEDFIDDKVAEFAIVKSYVPLKIKIFWDPPTVGAASQALEKTIEEMEFDLLVRRESPDAFKDDE
jgi:hypothetical protein